MGGLHIAITADRETLKAAMANPEAHLTRQCAYGFSEYFYQFI